jgi:hypothetical protein
MKILVEELRGDAAVMLYNKNGELIHTEGFYGKTTSHYIRNIDTPGDYDNYRVLTSGHAIIRVVV